jgi:hypothetical protein
VAIIELETQHAILDVLNETKNQFSTYGGCENVVDTLL